MPKPKPPPPPPPAIITNLDVVYTTTPIPLACDIRQPLTGGPFPAVIAIFGGAWKQGSKEAVAPYAIRLAGEESIVSVAPSHRLAPDGGIYHAPAPMDDLRAFYDWLQANAATYNVDPTRIAAMGGSSGGHLALFLGSDRPLKCVVSASGPSALDLFDDDGGGSQVGLMENFMGFPETTDPQAWRDASPYYRVSPTSPPTYLVNSLGEVIPEQQSQRYYNALLAAGVSAQLRLPSGSAHGWNIWNTEALWDEAVMWMHPWLA